MRLATNVSLATLVLVSACATPDAPTAVITPVEPLAARPAPSTPLAMTTRDVDDLGVTTHIRGDGLGDYVHGQQGMQVELDQYGNMQIGPTNSTTPPQRTINIDYANPVDPANTYRPDPAGQLNFRFVSNKSATGAPAIHELGVNGAPSAACYAMTVAHRNASTHHRDVFNTASAAEATFAYVTRISLAPSQWAVESGSPLCGANPHVAAVYSQDLTRKNAPLVFRGYFYQRLSLVLRAL